jgi:hypothetical protein
MSTAELAKLSAADRHKLVTVPIDGQGLKTLLEAGMIWLKTNQQNVRHRYQHGSDHAGGIR